MPFFFEFMTLLALRVFVQQKVDVAVLEVTTQPAARHPAAILLQHGDDVSGSIANHVTACTLAC